MTIDNYGYKFYNEVLKSPKLIIAPMVDYSELPFRELCRTLFKFKINLNIKLN